MYTRKKQRIIISSLVLTVCFVYPLAIQAQTRELPLDLSTLFTGSGRCAVCHVTDGSALLDSRGVDLSPATHWRSTMMANAARDPYWQAKVESEVLTFPAIKEIIEDKCTTCHTPMARTQVVYDGAAGYSLSEARQSPLAMDGVSCTLCHQIQSTNLGEGSSFSGGYVVDDSRTIFGPYTNVMDGAMRATVNYNSVFGEHLNGAELCATCHTLYTPYLDDTGQIAGTFPEQMAYWEWRGSIYPAEGTVCQRCHMPRIEEPVTIASIPPGLNPQSPFGQHFFVGGNTFMQQLIHENAEEIGATAEDDHFHATVARTILQLQEAANISFEAMVEENVLQLDVTVENTAGHKLPTGFPSRRAWIYVAVRNATGQLVFESGRTDDEGRLLNLSNNLEPHYDIVDSETQVQIYESRMVDVNNELTHTLLRGADYIKDNRIPPKGFTSDAERYDDMAIKGNAANDSNFNRTDGAEGSGSDVVSYLIDISGESGVLSVTVGLIYQAINPAFIDDLASHTAPAITRFLGYYEVAEKLPALVAFAEKTVDLGTGTAVESLPELPETLELQQNYPNPFYSSTVIPFGVSKAQASVSLLVYDLQGRLIRKLTEGIKTEGRYYEVWDGRDDSGRFVGSGLYMYQLTVDGVTETKTLVHTR